MAGRPDATTGAGLLLTGVGAAVLLSPSARRAGFGWFAYAPVSEQQLDSLVVVNGPRAVGGALVVLGLVLVALAVGLRLGRAGRVGTAPARRGLVVLAALLVAAGAVALAVPQRFVSVGGALPRSMDDAGPDWSLGTSLVSPTQAAGAAGVVLGLLLLTGVLGARRGASRRRQE